jgi:glucose uptake protein GlcU
MTIPSPPEERPKASGIDPEEEMPSAIPQSVMTVISVLAFTDWGNTAAALLGLIIAAALILAWMRMPKRGPSD